jgi:predicted DNA-binding ribbon-helix-helix protein
MKIRRKSLIVKRSIRVAGRRTGVSVEDAFWNRFKEIAADRNMTLSDLVTTINSKRKHNNLSSSVRLFVLDHDRRASRPSAEEAPERQMAEAVAVTECRLDDEQRKRQVQERD